MIIRCLAENFEDDTKVKACIACFENDQVNMETQEGIDEAKKCANTYLPLGVAECPREIEALTPGDDEQVDEILECFDDRLEKANAERCLNGVETTDVEAALTKGSMCILDSWKDAYSYVKNVTRPRRRGGRRQGRGERFEKAKGRRMKKIMMEMTVAAHCQLANKDDTTKEEECLQCFRDAVPSKLGSQLGRRPRQGHGQGMLSAMPREEPGNRGRREADPHLQTALTRCSQNHLSPLYDDCTTLMETDKTDMKAAHDCHSNILIGNLVSQCVTENDIVTVDADSLNEVILCGTENAFIWMSERNPKAADMLGKFLERMGDHDDHNEDD